MAAKKRKASRQAEPTGDKSFRDEGKVTMTTYEDVADSEDEFHMNRDQVMLDDGPEAKRRRKQQEADAFLEPSDEELLGYSDESSEDEAPQRTKKSRAASPEDGDELEEDEDAEGWGTSKKDYYNADTIETEADALEEEAEARRLQQKRLAKMTDADFGLDDWLDVGKDDATGQGEEGDVVVEVLKDIEVTPDMPAEERYRILQTRYPEFDFLAGDFITLHPLLQTLIQTIEENPSFSHTHPTVIKSRALAAYVGTISMYFAFLSSPASQGLSRCMDPTELHDHEIMDYLMETRTLWQKVKDLEAPIPVEAIFEDLDSADEIDVPQAYQPEKETVKSSKKARKELARTLAASSAAEERALALADAEASLSTLSSLRPSKSSRPTSKKAVLEPLSDDSDFGEEESLTAKSAAEKAARKKSLQFYTSQIAQKANKRAGAGRDAGGDNDLPYKERLRDRQERLNVEAERRGKKLDEYGRGGASADLGGSDNEEELAENLRGEEDEYYDMVAGAASSKKIQKASKEAAMKAAKEAGKLARVVEVEMDDEDGKRAIGYVIEKNKGLAPKRKKEVRNPRVKKRMKYEEKKKKLASMKATYKGGEERGGYGGEKTGIKANLIKSTKL